MNWLWLLAIPPAAFVAWVAWDLFRPFTEEERAAWREDFDDFQ